MTSENAPFDLRERFADLFELIGLLAACDEMEDDLRIGRRLEDRTIILQALTDLAEVGEVAVVGDGEVAGLVQHGEGLDVGLVVRGHRRWNSGYARWPPFP